VGRTLDEIDNQVTGTTKACFEPALDYCVVKIPRWPFDKFTTGDRSLFTQMKATGEVMAIDRSFEAALMKALRGLEVRQKDLRHPKFAEMGDDLLRIAIRKPTDERLWALAEGLRRGWTVDEVNRISRVDRWFLRKIQTLLRVESKLVHAGESESPEVGEVIQEAFLLGFPSPTIASILGVDSASAQTARSLQKSSSSEVLDTSAVDWKVLAAFEIERQKVMPVFKMVDTCAGEFESRTPYYYGTFEQEDDALPIK
jgi:carbamoyl-phosphate synthase large subunit